MKISKIAHNTLRAALNDVQMGHMVGTDLVPVYDVKDFLDITVTDPTLSSICEGNSPADLGICLVHYTETYRSTRDV